MIQSSSTKPDIVTYVDGNFLLKWRCSEDFDHHCIWLNICVGGKNYKPFFVTISMVSLNFFFYLLAIFFLTEEMRALESNMQTVGFILMWMMGVVVLVFEFLIMSLILLHIYLYSKGLSTLQFVTLRDEQALRESE